MVVAGRTAAALALVAGLSLTGCLVSFEDYPLAALNRGGAGGSGAAGADTGGATTGGSETSDAGTGGSAGSESAVAGNGAGGMAAGGMAAGGMAAGGSGGTDLRLSDLMIDDFEDGDGHILPLAGRNGSWFVANDGTAQQIPSPNAATLPSLLSPPNGASTRALHTSGYGFTGWGALIGANFVVSGTMPVLYDISAHKGVSFLAKLGKTTAASQLRVAIQDYDTRVDCSLCGDDFGALVTLGNTFQTITVPFSSLKQAGWGKPQAAAFDPTRTYALTFSWPPHVTFDVWIDDVSFY
ncbi:MAG TPA: hypothetical protein VNW92_06500 [Polyangiaceae bacterium]|jgi:hypothetical protein|nr:hypothetical protein [Polyangiaceae bacterium]